MPDGLHQLLCYDFSHIMPKSSFLLAALLLLCVPATGQSTAKTKAAPAKSPAVPAAKPAAPAPATELPVATITGTCSVPGKTDCAKALTRADFDRIIAAINPEIKTEQRRALASEYVQVYALANEARKAGVDKDPVFAQRMQLEEMKSLAAAYSELVRKQLKPTDAEIETFYAENRDRFEEMQLRAVILPKTIAKESKPAETKLIAEQLLARAAAGEDMDKLQTDGTLAVKSEAAAPNTDLGWRGRGRLGPFEKQITALKAGQITNVLEDNERWYIFKVTSKRLVPLANVKSDIENAIVNERFNAGLLKLLQGVHVDLDPKYFGAPPTEQSAAQPDTKR
jgi:peptidyl-prolyl cis-trans isomerase C